MAKFWKQSRRAIHSTTKNTLQGRAARRLRCEHLEDRRLLAVVTVDTVEDIVDFNDGVTSLREAIFATNLVPGADEINFDFGFDGPATILLTEGELRITDALTITGTGVVPTALGERFALLTIDASGNDLTPEVNDGQGSSVFVIDDNNDEQLISVEIMGLGITGGDGDRGGGINSQEQLVLRDVVVENNSSDWGGGIYNRGVMELLNSSVVHNSTTGNDGGGIYSSGELHVVSTIISENFAGDRDVLGGSGGGISGGGVLSIFDSTISKNRTGMGLVDRSSFSGGGGYGGGIFFSGELTISRSVVQDNIGGNGTANERFGGGRGGQGGGIAHERGTLTLVDSLVSNNSAGDGGEGQNSRGGKGGGILGRASSLNIVRSRISGNTAGNGGSGSRAVAGMGGGIYLYRSELLLLDSTVVANLAGNTNSAGSIFRTDFGTNFLFIVSPVGHGGGIFSNDSEVTVNNSSISNNRAGSSLWWGGWGGGVTALRSDWEIIDSTISENRAGSPTDSSFSRASGGTGGGIFQFEGEMHILNSAVNRNAAGNAIVETGLFVSGGRAGGISSLSTLDTESRLFITNSTVSGNSAGIASTEADNPHIVRQGNIGGISAQHLELRNSTVASNRSLGEIGGVRVGDFLAHNSIIASNTGADLDLSGDDLSDVEVDYSLIGDTTNLTVEQLDAINAGEGNLLDVDPLLGPLVNNGGAMRTHALLAGSPAINLGDPNAVAGQNGVPEFDQRGAPYGRIVGTRIDIGAYESQPEGGLLDGDFDQDGDIDGFDFLAWQRGYGNSFGSEASDGDATGDGDVDEHDLAVWKVTYEQDETTSAALEQSAMFYPLVAELFRDSQAGDGLSTKASEIDALLGAESSAIESVLATVKESDLGLLRSTTQLETLAYQVEAEDADDPWLVDRLLERVFGGL